MGDTVQRVLMIFVVTSPAGWRSNATVTPKFLPGTSQGESATTNLTAEYRPLFLTTDDVDDCLKRSLRLEYRTVSGFIQLNRAPRGSYYGKCRIRLVAPVGRVLRFQLPPTYHTEDLAIRIEDSQRRPMSLNQWIVNEWYQTNPLYAYTISNNVTMIISKWSCLQLFSPIHIPFLSMDQQPQLVVHRVSNTSGYIQSPLWDEGSPYPTGLDVWAVLEVPEGFVVMISYTEPIWSRCKPNTTFSVYQGGQGLRHLKQVIYCSPITPLRPISVYNSTVHLRFITGNSNEGLDRGFQAVYTLHLSSTTLRKVDTNSSDWNDLYESGNVWNCSVPSFEDFVSHFPCNIRWNCVNGEDEKNCSYTNLDRDRCGTGGLWIAGRCFKLVRQKFPSWTDAALACKQHDGTLASLNTIPEWEGLQRKLPLHETEQAFFGLKTFPAHISLMYDNLWQWDDGSTAFFRKTVTKNARSGRNSLLKPFCGLFTWTNRALSARYDECNQKKTDGNVQGALCEFQPRDESTDDLGQYYIPEWSSAIEDARFPVGTIRCITGNRVKNRTHVTHEFLACDTKTDCLVSSQQSEGHECPGPWHQSPPSFVCSNGVQRVPYMLVCDHRLDCNDGSDENFCSFPSCDPRLTFDCGDGQCIPKNQVCDFMAQCVLASDERLCMEEKAELSSIYGETSPPPAIIDMDSRGLLAVKPLYILDLGNWSCPSTHFKCSTSYDYCLPIYLLCNDVVDCPGREDEDDLFCKSYACGGFYRCRDSRICVHPNHMCDNMYGQCPQNDDELLCGLICPPGCRCFGMAFYCNESIAAGEYRALRFLHAESSNMTLEDLENNTMLVDLSLVKCFLREAEVPHLPNLHQLDLSDNLLTHVHEGNFQKIENLHRLNLAGNPLDFELSTPAITVLTNLQVLDLSRVQIAQINPGNLKKLSHLHTLNLSHTGIRRVLGDGFQPLMSLRSVDLFQCPLTSFSAKLFKNLSNLESVKSSSYKICCPEIFPTDFNPAWCEAPSDLVSSCEDLLKSNVYRVTLFLLAILSLAGSSASCLYWNFVRKDFRTSACGFLVSHLAVSDFFRGMCLLMIGLADTVYRGIYLWRDLNWRHSMACIAAGFVFVVSLEVSVFLVSIVTMDRFVVLVFPVTRRRLSPKSAKAVSVAAWIAGFLVATMPVLPVPQHLEAYSQTGICIPLPITHNDDMSHVFSTAVFHTLNFVLVLFIAIQQGAIVCIVNTTLVISSDTSKKTQDLIQARRLITVAVSAFVCWCPISVLGWLALRDVPIPGEIKVAMAMLVLPLNSATNPFLYATSIFSEHRRKRQEKRLLTILARR